MKIIDKLFLSLILLFTAGCFAETVAVIDTVTNIVGTTIQAKQEPVVIKTAECGNVPYIMPDKESIETMNDDLCGEGGK